MAKLFDLITLNNHIYRVLNIEDNILTLLSMEDLCIGEFNDNTSTYYNSTIDKMLSNLPLNDNILPEEITQYVYDEDLCHASTVPVGERKIYIPSIEDILNYASLNDFDLIKMFWPSVEDIQKSPYIWLRSKGDDDTVFIVNGLIGCIERCAYNDLCAVRPMFKVELT